MNNNLEQVFYITYRQNDGYLDGMITEDHYNNRLPDVEKKKYTQVIVDLPHLAGWGIYWTKCRYINHALSYPDNYPKDQSTTIKDLKDQISKMIASNNDKQKSNEDLQNKLNQANEKINVANGQISELKKLSSKLQLQVANAANVAANAARSDQGGHDHVSK